MNAQKIINLSFVKLAKSKSQKCGLDLRKSLLVTTVIYAAKTHISNADVSPAEFRALKTKKSRNGRKRSLLKRYKSSEDLRSRNILGTKLSDNEISDCVITPIHTEEEENVSPNLDSHQIICISPDNSLQPCEGDWSCDDFPTQVPILSQLDCEEVSGVNKRLSTCLDVLSTGEEEHESDGSPKKRRRHAAESSSFQSTQYFITKSDYHLSSSSESDSAPDIDNKLEASVANLTSLMNSTITLPNQTTSTFLDGSLPRCLPVTAY